MPSTIASKPRRIALATALACATLTAAATSHAQPSSNDRALAETLFREAKRLMNDARYAEACPKLAESQRLDPGGGTLLNLGLCHRAEGKTATAWAELRDAVAVAHAEGRKDREKIANEAIAELEPALSRVTIDTSALTDVPGVTVKLDDTAVNKAAWSVAIPADPGAHTISVNAPGKVSWRSTFSLGASDKKAIAIPALVDAGPERAAPETKPAASTSNAPLSTNGHGQRTAGILVGATGVAALAAGGVLGGLAISNRKESDSFCSGKSCTDPRGVAANERAKRLALASDITLGAGVVALGVGAVLLLTSPRDEKRAAPPSAVRVAPFAGAGSAGIDLRGSW